MYIKKGLNMCCTKITTLENITTTEPKFQDKPTMETKQNNNKIKVDLKNGVGVGEDLGFGGGSLKRTH